MKKVLITGANGTLGRELTTIFRNRGFELHLHARNSVPGFGMYYGDLTNRETLQRIGASLRSTSLDVLICNAGTYNNGKIYADEVDQSIKTNLIANIHLVYDLWEALSRAHGVIVFVNSLAALTPSFGEEVYAASKAGLRAFAQALQYRASSSHVRVITVLLGAMQGRMTAQRGVSQEGLISPVEVADGIFQLCNCSATTLSTKEVVFGRSVYP